MIDDNPHVATNSGTIINLADLTGEQLRHLAALADEREARALPPDDEELRDSLWRTATRRMAYSADQAAIVKALADGVHPMAIIEAHGDALLVARFGTAEWPTVGYFRAQLAVAA